jgi:alpha-1,3-glucan synthase
MRAFSAKQRFPVQQWKEDLEILQAKAIQLHRREKGKFQRLSMSMLFESKNPISRPGSAHVRDGSKAHSTIGGDVPPTAYSPEWPLGSSFPNSSSTSVAEGPQANAGIQQIQGQQPPGRRIGPGHGENPDQDPDEIEEDTDYRSDYPQSTDPSPFQSRVHSRNTSIQMAPPFAPSPAAYNSATRDLAPASLFIQPASLNSSLLSLDSIVQGKKDFQLQQVDPFFTDSSGEFYKTFEKLLETLSGKNSESALCIEEFLVESERSWFNRFRNAKLGRLSVPSAPPSLHDSNSNWEDDYRAEFVSEDYRPPKGLKKYMMMKIGDWPIYSLVLAFGQIISANSYQITLITGTVGQSADKLYTVASVYLATTIIWWMLFRRLRAVMVLSTPFAFYGLAFVFLGIAPFAGTANRTSWLQNVATMLYATASSSGSLFFAMNFGDEGGAPVKDWVTRACLIQGTQQIWVVALWYWGSTLQSSSSRGSSQHASNPTVIIAVALTVAVIIWALGIVIALGLPDFYRQAPGKVASFYSTIFRRKIIMWTLVTVLIQNYFLSAPYGRNWQFLWSSRSAPTWAIALLVLFFFVVLWAAILYVLMHVSAYHSWILPIFAIGLGAPRWCQMLWSTSSIGLYLPWAGGPIASALVSRSLWLWLGLLDTIQGVGFGMILLQTLTRIHIAFTLMAAQVVGSIAAILARATAPNAIGEFAVPLLSGPGIELIRCGTGPGDVFPDLSEGAVNVLNKAWFWVALAAQIFICVGCES